MVNGNNNGDTSHWLFIAGLSLLVIVLGFYLTLYLTGAPSDAKASTITIAFAIVTTLLGYLGVKLHNS